MQTPLESYPQLADAIGIPALYFKREDMHQYGSHKGRSIPVMIETYYKKGDRKFAISSSGNAALAAALYIREINLKAAEPVTLDIFVGNNIAPHKLDRLKELADDSIRVLIKERPLQTLTQVAQEGIRSLRQSTDDTALIGYESLAEELAAIKDAGAVFMGTSSGTTAQALAEYFAGSSNVRKHESTTDRPIQMHIIQTSSCHPMSDAFESFDGVAEKSTADAIVDQTAQRKSVLIPLIEKTGGRGWIATNDDIKGAQELVKKHTDLDISTNSALSVVGLMKAAYLGIGFKGAAVCMICGE